MSMRNMPNVLVVDDEPHLRELLVDALAGEAVNVTVAASGKEAIAMARASAPDLLVTDPCLGDCTGLDVIDHLRGTAGDLPAVVITGQGDPRAFSEASRRRPVEVLNKPLDLDRLRATIRTELSRQEKYERLRTRTRKLRRLAREANLCRREVSMRLQTSCDNLTAAYRNLGAKHSAQKLLVSYQRDLLAARNDDDVFKAIFTLLVKQSGPLFGFAMACDANAELQMIGRFGVPRPDGSNFCHLLAKPIIANALTDPSVQVIDAETHAELFDETIRRKLIGVTVLGMPLLPVAGEMIGMVVLYRRGEQPFTEQDVELVQVLSEPTAIAVKRND